MTDAGMAWRVAVATLCGVVIGYERARDGKTIGMRTLGLVGLASGLLVAVMIHAGASLDTSGRVIQGLLAGVGFLGAGAILHTPQADHPRGLTTAAAVWITSILGTVAGLGHLAAALACTVLAYLLLALGPHVDSAVHRQRQRPGDEHADRER